MDLISATTTKTGLKVKSRIDSRQYATGTRVSTAALAEVRLVPDKFHGEWNYTIYPSGHPDAICQFYYRPLAVESRAAEFAGQV